MNKRIGDIEINFGMSRPSEDSWVRISLNHNSTIKEEIQIRGLNHLLDLEYAVKCIKREMINEPFFI